MRTHIRTHMHMDLRIMALYTHGHGCLHGPVHRHAYGHVHWHVHREVCGQVYKHAYMHACMHAVQTCARENLLRASANEMEQPPQVHLADGPEVPPPGKVRFCHLAKLSDGVRFGSDRNSKVTIGNRISVFLLKGNQHRSGVGNGRGGR